MPIYVYEDAQVFSDEVREIECADGEQARNLAKAHCTTNSMCCYQGHRNVLCVHDVGFAQHLSSPGAVTFIAEAGSTGRDGVENFLGHRRGLKPCKMDCGRSANRVHDTCCRGCSSGQAHSGYCDRAVLNPEVFEHGLQSGDAVQQHAISLAKGWGLEVLLEHSQEYGERRADRVRHMRGHDYSPPGIGWVGIAPGDHSRYNRMMNYNALPPQDWECHLDRVIKIALHNPDADFDHPLGYHGLRTDPDSPIVKGTWRGSLQPPQLEPTNGANGRGVYLTPSFRMAASYAYRHWGGPARHGSDGPSGLKYLLVFMCAVPPDSYHEGRGTAFSHNTDGWDTSKIEWVIPEASRVQVYGALVCYFRPRVPLEKSLLTAFHSTDANRNGVIEREELQSLMKRLDKDGTFDDGALNALMDAVDKNQDGKIQVSEFVAWVTGSSGSLRAQLLSGGPASSLVAPSDLASYYEHRDMNYMSGEEYFSFNGSTSFARMRRPIQDDFTIVFDFRTTQNEGGGGQWYNGCGLVDAEVAGITDDFGISIGQGHLMFGTGNPDLTIISPKPCNDGQWHSVLATRHKASGRFELFIDGDLIGSQTGSTRSLCRPGYVDIGRLQTGTHYFAGDMRNIFMYGCVLHVATPSGRAPEATLTVPSDLATVDKHQNVEYDPSDKSFSFNGSSSFVRIARPVQDDFTITFDFCTTQDAGGGGQWYNGCGLVDAEVAGITNDFGITMGRGRVMFGIGKPDRTITTPLAYNDGKWHSVFATRHLASGRFELFVDQVHVESQTGGQQSLTAPRYIDIGRIQTGTRYFEGRIRNVCVYSGVILSPI